MPAGTRGSSAVWRAMQLAAAALVAAAARQDRGASAFGAPHFETMAKLGRPTKVTKQRTEAFCEAISIGCTDAMAAAYARIDADTAINWLNRGKTELERRAKGETPQEGEQPFVDFFGSVEQARMEAGIRWQAVVDKAANTDPNFALRMLKIRFRSDYQEVNQTEISGPAGGPVPIAVVKMPVDEL